MNDLTSEEKQFIRQAVKWYSKEDTDLLRLIDSRDRDTNTQTFLRTRILLADSIHAKLEEP